MHRENGIDDRDEPAAHARGLSHDSLTEFLDCDYRRLVAGLTLLSGCRASAEDAVQEALARAWERGQRGEQINSLRAFVAVVATNLLRSRFRRLLVEQRARHRLGDGLHGTSSQVEAHLASADLRVDLARAMQKLPRRQRDALALYYFADLSVQDIALALETRPETAKGLLHRGRQSLLRVLGPAYEERADHAG